MLLKIMIAMLAFAANSVLCRLALAGQQIDPMSFSLIRVASGAAVLLLLYCCSAQKARIEWKLKNGFFLAVYLVAFSLAYLHMDAGAGALLLFGAVQLSMLGYGLCHGEKINLQRGIGLGIAVTGILVLLLPGSSAPNPLYAAVMVCSGLGWAAYSIAGKAMQNPLASTLANFILALPFVLLAYAVFDRHSFVYPQGALLAVLSGGLAEQAGLQVGQEIVAVDGEATPGWAGVSLQFVEDGDIEFVESVHKVAEKRKILSQNSLNTAQNAKTYQRRRHTLTRRLVPQP